MEEAIEADTVLIAVGRTRTRTALPRRLLVVGGGFIACEFASVFAGLGTEVVQVNRGHRLLKQHDMSVSTTS
ncbi:FAD-dependent oxidoreductase [Corynebacterium diphtheriae]